MEGGGPDIDCTNSCEYQYMTKAKALTETGRAGSRSSEPGERLFTAFKAPSFCWDGACVWTVGGGGRGGRWRLPVS